ncbi:hypothetical protein D9M71_478080 [compost metagenome]
MHHVAADEELQALQRQIGELCAAAYLQADTQRSLHALVRREAGRGGFGHAGAEFGLNDAQGPEHALVATAEFAGGLLATDQMRAQGGAGGQAKTGEQAALGVVGLELHHGHGRQRRHVVRAYRVEQLLGEARELRLHLQLHPRREETETFEQALDVGVGHLAVLQPQASRGFGIAAGELRAHFEQVVQLAVVEFQQLVHLTGPRASG